jgi:hypothetical protein
MRGAGPFFYRSHDTYDLLNEPHSVAELAHNRTERAAGHAAI